MKNPSTYYVLKGDWSAIPEETSIPLVEERPTSIDFFTSIWSTESLMYSWPEVSVSVTSSTPMLDYLMTAGGIDVCSELLLEKVLNFGGDVEGLPINVLNRSSVTKIDVPYYVLHPLCSFSAFDLSKSSRRSSGKIKTLTPSEELMASGIPILRDNEHYLILVSEDLKVYLESCNVSGCQFIDLKSYK